MKRTQHDVPRRAADKTEKATMKKRATPMADELYDAEFPHETVVGEDTATTGSGGADDALGLYLKQMGAIPLLVKSEKRNCRWRFASKRLASVIAAPCCSAGGRNSASSAS